MGKNEASKLKALLAIASIDISLEFDMILQRIVEITCVTINAHSGTMMLVDEATGVLRMAVSHGLGHDYIERVDEAARKAGVNLASGPHGTALETGTCCHVPNIFQEPGSRPWYDLSRELGFSSQIFAPMKIGTKPTGLLNVHWAEPRQFTDDESNFVIEAASHAAMVVQNALMCAGLKSNEKLAKSCEELIETDRIKTEFISNISHELLTPLTSIKGFTELLRDERSGDINEEQKKKLDTIYRNTEKLIGLIRELLDVAHLEKNKFGLHFGLVSMNDIITRSIQNIYPQATDKDITIIPEIKRLPRIWGDEERLTNVLNNLLSNAIKFTPRKGTVTIIAGEEAKDIKISVTDTGIGIPDDKLTRIFEKFYQIDGSSNRKYGGVGIGLSVCKSIIESHYGSIWAESYGGGSTFNIVLPKLSNRRDTEK